jgi:hypothetical protein
VAAASGQLGGIIRVAEKRSRPGRGGRLPGAVALARIRELEAAGERLGYDLLEHRLDRSTDERSLGTAESESDQRTAAVMAHDRAAAQAGVTRDSIYI